MAEAFGFYIDNLVTKDHLDVRLNELETRMSERFAEADKQFVQLEPRMDERFAQVDKQFAQATRCLSWSLPAPLGETCSLLLWRVGTRFLGQSKYAPGPLILYCDWLGREQPVVLTIAASIASDCDIVGPDRTLVATKSPYTCAASTHCAPRTHGT